jgi:SAM-dependent methyltransferase
MNRIDEIIHIANQNSVKPYQINFVVDVERSIGFKGKKVLEVGGSLPQNFVLEGLQVESWTGLEYTEYYDVISGFSFNTPLDCSLQDIENGRKLSQYQVVSGKIEDLPYPMFSQFDLIFSVAAFQHIQRFTAALEKMYQALKLGGYLVALASPVWSSTNGHLLTSVEDRVGNTFHFGNSPIPAWGHLLMRPPQLYELLCEHTDLWTAGKIIYEVYQSLRVNRFFTEDYIQFVRSSPFFNEKAIVKSIFPTQIVEDLQQKLEFLHPGYKNFSDQGLVFMLVRLHY